jgi:hypothetical protein
MIRKLAGPDCALPHTWDLPALTVRQRAHPHRRSPMTGFNVTWLTAYEESMVDDTLLSVGRRSAEERIASTLILLYKR